jgi:hypothetical protein
VGDHQVKGFAANELKDVALIVRPRNVSGQQVTRDGVVTLGDERVTNAS